MMLPSKEQLQSLTQTWVLSLGSNVHVAIDRKLFTEFTEYESHVGTPPNSLAVKGVGTVELELQATDGSDGHKLTLNTVLYVPGYMCNVLGGPIVSNTSHPYEIDFPASKLRKSFTDTVVGTFETEPFMHLRLKNYDSAVSIIDKDFARELRILVAWSPGEQLRYNAFQRGEDYEDGAQFVEAPYDEAEIAWLKKTHKGEYCFLARNGLSIHVEGQRVAGRKLAREQIKKQYASEKTLMAELKKLTEKPDEVEPIINANNTSHVDYPTISSNKVHVPIANTQGTAAVDYSAVFSQTRPPVMDAQSTKNMEDLAESNKENDAPLAQPKTTASATYVPLHMRINLGEVTNK